MEHNPSLTPNYLAGKVDEYVKFQGRDTIMRNARRDRNCRYARIPDGGACDFCRMLGSRGFVYHSEKSAGGVSHGSKFDTYHPFCNCQIAVCFDPFIEKYQKGWTTVTRGYGAGEVVRPGRDGSTAMREVDVDALYEEYLAMGRSFNAGSRLKDYTRGARLSDEAFDAAMRRLADARTLDELHAVGDDIVRNWPRNDNGRDKSQWDEMSRFAKELEKRFSEEEVGRAAKSLDDWGGSFGKKLEPTREEYRKSSDVEKTFNERWGTRAVIDGSVKELPEEKRTAFMAGIDKGMQIVGDQARKIVHIEVRDLEDDETLGFTSRREGDRGVIFISPKVFREYSLDQIEQIAFHEVAHTAEWKLTNYEEWEAEQDRLREWRREKARYEYRQAEDTLIDGEEPPKL
ncbi:MAG: hypothetical protein IJ087_11225, partial [Eggerthellaceae bacterium]|nr:hypothetical protein [Eggerthellaceae bacterium]